MKGEALSVPPAFHFHSLGLWTGQVPRSLDRIGGEERWRGNTSQRWSLPPPPGGFCGHPAQEVSRCHSEALSASVRESFPRDTRTGSEGEKFEKYF